MEWAKNMVSGVTQKFILRKTYASCSHYFSSEPPNCKSSEVSTYLWLTEQTRKEKRGHWDSGVIGSNVQSDLLGGTSSNWERV